jgi:hypothetical protein
VFALLASGSRVPRRIGRHRLSSIAIDGIVAAVERRRSAPVLSERTLRDQHRVLVTLHEGARAILPVRFGAQIEIAELERVVRLRRGVLARALTKVRGKAQMTVRVFGAAAVQARAPLPRSGTEYLEARVRASRPDVPAIGEAIRRAVKSLVAAESIETGRGGVRVVIEHLIRRDNVERYRERVARVLAAAGEDADAVALSGPWPPSAFVPDIMEARS